MEKSIETIWKEGFLNKNALVAPQINDLYNQKSGLLIDKIKRLFKINLFAIVGACPIIIIVHYLLNATWQGVIVALLLLGTALYSWQQMKGLKNLNQGDNSYDYLKSFNDWLKSTMAKTSKVMRFSYPIYFLIAMSTILSAWSSQPELIAETAEKFPDLTFIGDYPLVVLVIMGIGTLLFFFFSDKIYQFDVRLIYGRIFDKLEETIAEMEQLRSE